VNPVLFLLRMANCRFMSDMNLKEEKRRKERRTERNKGGRQKKKNGGRKEERRNRRKERRKRGEKKILPLLISRYPSRKNNVEFALKFYH
jgi:hypothetical protein